MDPSDQPASIDRQLQTHTLRVERKNFTFSVRENPRGQFLRITEEVNGRYDTVIVPMTGIEQFRDVLIEIVRIAKSGPPQP